MDAFHQVQSLIQQGLHQGAYPCAALAVGIGRTTYLEQYCGTCNAHTLFDMASVTKILSPTMIAFRFLEEGMLRLYDTVGDFFPDAPDDKREITILHLMTHTSGIPAHFLLSNEASDPDDAVRAILRHPLDRIPGASPVYSCMGYILLGRILEQTGGAPLDILAQKYVFEPLGMEHSGYHPTGDIAPTELDPSTGKPLQVFTTKMPVFSEVSPEMPAFSAILEI